LRVDGIFRDAKIGKNLLKSLSRNLCTDVPFETILKDMKVLDSDISRQTLYAYYNVLERIHIIEDLPA
jgi:predicted AAA+ superfamily ATPase